MLNLPNILTLSRIAILPVLIGLFYFDDIWAPWVALGVYIIAAMTDFLDGYLARSWNETSTFGQFLDPISDKIFVSCLLLALVAFDRLEGVWLVPAIVIFVREFLISGLREFLAPKNITLPVSRLAKWKTALQMTALGFLVVGDAGNVLVPQTLLIGQIGLSVAAVLTVITGWHYIQIGFKHLNDA